MGSAGLVRGLRLLVALAPPRQFILPHLKKEVETAHARGVKFGYIMTTGAMPLLDMIQGAP